ncbi:MAG: ATP-dependent DNA helicase RecG [Chthonomonas sp.]|nr:ATP-dependent DNA helicase RecG [Chthonomonas sp.]
MDDFAPQDRLATEIQYLKGVGPKWAVPLGKLGLRKVRDVLYHFPRRYEDRRNLPPIRLLVPGEVATVRGEIRRLESRTLRGGRVILTATLTDGTGEVTLTWFNQPWIRKKLDGAEDVIAFGMVRESRGSRTLEISAPEIELPEDEDDVEAFARLTPVYPSTEGVPQTVLRKATDSALQGYISAVAEALPRQWRQRANLIGIREALTQIHRPDSEDTRRAARRRLVFEEFFFMQLALQMRRRETQQEVGIGFDWDEPNLSGGGLFADGQRMDIRDQLGVMLPFELTGAQKRVIQDVWNDMQRPAPMNRLVQGDVGSGKTAVAAAAMLAAVRAGYQAALMAPTEILAEQHFLNLQAVFDRVGIKVVLLHGKMPAPKKRKATQQAENGEAQILVGTHALVQESVTFHKLGLAVVDEQHRFGVLQRAALRQKGRENPDVLVMTATPIPRTLTMTLYGDLDVSIIDELPPGRRPIKTHWKRPHERDQVYSAVRDILTQGRQAYFVCPMIAESEKLQAQAAEELYERLRTEHFPDYRVGLLHGNMKSAEKEEIMGAFRRHELDILVSTVVIEVGVDVPNATVMTIEDANRFGLAQLHQLRGRVGRGSFQSYCILIADAKTDESITRMSTIRDTTDGFKIAEVDLQLRGPGDVAGTRQSGQFDFKLADLVQDTKLLEESRALAMEVLEQDPDLARPDHAVMLERVRERRAIQAVAVVS